MTTPGFWIGRHSNPDTVILSPQEIIRLNRQIREELHLTKDLSQWPQSASGEALRARLRTQFNDLQSRALVRLNGERPPAAYWPSMEAALNLDAIPVEMARQYGLIVRYADQRFLPLEEGLYAQAYDVDFDELQNSALDIGTPVVILHRSLDGQWLWVESSLSAGWVKAKNAAAVREDQIKLFWSTPFVVVTAPKADIYLNREMTDFYGSVLMGARLPLMRADGDCLQITIPRREADGSATLVPGFVATADIHAGYLTYTPRHVLTQAFKMIHQPYGWGGMYGGQDCSKFLQEVFATVGIELPRDSKNQIQTGEATALGDAATPGADKLRVLADSAIGGITLLGMKGHIMLYLGVIEGRAYAIHSFWAYRRPRGGRDETFVVNRAAVSDLTLGEGSKRGSLLDRLNAARIVK